MDAFLPVYFPFALTKFDPSNLLCVFQMKKRMRRSAFLRRQRTRRRTKMNTEESRKMVRTKH